MNCSESNTKEAITALVRQCDDRSVIYRNRRGAAWLCSVESLDVREDSFNVQLVPIRRVDTAMWRFHAPPEPFNAGAPWETLTGRKHAIVATHYIDWCITFDPVKVEEIEALAAGPKMRVGDILSELKRVELE